MQQPSKIAMLSYNTFLPGFSNGWVEGKLLLIQDRNGAPWGAPQFGPLAQKAVLQDQGDQQIARAVGSHWQQLTEHLPTLGRVIIYVGDRGSEGTIEHAAKHGLDPAKALFVFCDCNMRAKEALIKQHGFEGSPRVMCECGGHQTMAMIARKFLATGELQ
ncbi:MAG: hypothetical protein HY457_00535 [Parcubacteria group bacterium]|nr:hypothetical protein [Parcubacteria group bacterium]